MAGVLLQNSLDGGRLGQVLAASAGGANFLALGSSRGVWGALPPAHEVLTACPPAMSSAGSLDERNQPPLGEMALVASSKSFHLAGSGLSLYEKFVLGLSQRGEDPPTAHP